MSEAEDFGGADAVSGETVPGHPALGLDEVVHQRNRVGILAVLAEAGQADFPYLRQLLGLAGGHPRRPLQVPGEAGLVMISKGYHRRRPRTWASITGEGRRALDAELASMQTLMTRLEALRSG